VLGSVDGVTDVTEKVILSNPYSFHRTVSSAGDILQCVETYGRVWRERRETANARRQPRASLDRGKILGHRCTQILSLPLEGL